MSFIKLTGNLSLVVVGTLGLVLTGVAVGGMYESETGRPLITEQTGGGNIIRVRDVELGNVCYIYPSHGISCIKGDRP